MDDLNSQAIPYMEPLTKDAGSRVRQAAVNAVNRITTRQARS
jgi:tetrahydromethanopterin S-methyltransferase subunit A